MGQVCSSNTRNVSQRHEEDKIMDEITIQDTKIDEFDLMFRQAIDPLNRLIFYNNAVIDELERIKEDAALAQGGFTLRLKKKNRHLRMRVVRLDDKIVGKDEMKLKCEQNPELHEACRRATKALDRLNDALTSANPYDMTEWELVNSRRLKVIKTGSQLKYIRQFDHHMFQYRKQLLAIANPDNKRVLKPSLEFESVCQEALETIPTLAQDLDRLHAQVVEFPDSVSALCSKHNMSPTETMGIMKKVKNNIRKISCGEALANDLTQMIQNTAKATTITTSSPARAAS